MPNENEEVIIPQNDSAAPAPAENGGVEVPETQTDPQEQTVPYSRFREVNERYKQDRERIAALESELYKKTAEDSDDEMRKKFVDFFGNTKEAEAFYEMQSEMAQRQAERLLAERGSKEDDFDPVAEEMENLEYSIGKKLNEDETEALYAAIDKLSPKDANGDYVSVVPFDAAYEYMTATRGTAPAKPVNPRAPIAGLSRPSGGNSQGAGGISRDVSYGSWRNRADLED